jgi:YaiO family outer membrane protein
MIIKYPKEYQYVLRKIDLYAEMGDFDSAYDLAMSSQEKNPDIEEFGFMVNELSIQYIKYLLEREDYERVKIIADNMIQLDPKDQLGYQYAISARVSMSEYEEAIQVINAALTEFPESKEYRLKLAGVYSEADKNDEAINVLKALVIEYPYNLLIRDAYIEALFKKAKHHQDRRQLTLAESAYREILSLKPSDPLAGLKLTLVLTESRDYLRALLEVDKSLKYNKGNNDLLLAKGVVYEKLKDWERALEFQSQYIPPYYKVEEHNEHLGYLRAKLLKNELSVTYLSARTDSIPVNTSVATIEYVRFGRYDTYTARVNYAARSSGVGAQAEFDWNINFKNKSSILANVGIGNQFFPDYKLGISYFKPFRIDWQAEIGGRYARLTDGRDFITAIGGVERTFNNVWLNGKVFLMSDTEELYTAVFLQSRFYMDNERDYISAMTSIGSAPEDPRLDFQANTLISFINTMVGAGYHHFFTHRTSLTILGNWYTYRFTDTSYVNQYNLLLSLRTKF